MWLSMSPGMTARPRRSILRVAGVASFRTSASVPTATMRSPRTAIACATVKRSSTVMIFPFEKMTSGAGCCAGRVDTAPANTSATTVARENDRLMCPPSDTAPRLRSGQADENLWSVAALDNPPGANIIGAAGRSDHT